MDYNDYPDNETYEYDHPESIYDYNPDYERDDYGRNSDYGHHRGLSRKEVRKEAERAAIMYGRRLHYRHDEPEAETEEYVQRPTFEEEWESTKFWCIAAIILWGVYWVLQLL